MAQDALEDSRNLLERLGNLNPTCTLVLRKVVVPWCKRKSVRLRWVKEPIGQGSHLPPLNHVEGIRVRDLGHEGRW